MRRMHSTMSTDETTRAGAADKRVTLPIPQARSSQGSPPPPSYRPSSIVTFAFCPQLEAFERAGWVPKVATKKLVAALWSTAAHAGFAFYQRALLDGDADPVHRVTAASQVAGAEWQAEIDHHTQHGVTFGTLDVEERRQDLVKLVQKYAKDCLINQPGWEVLAVEEGLMEDGNCRPDVVCRDPQGNIAPVDYKVKYEVNSKWFDMDGWIAEFRYSYKQSRYCWELARKYKQPCRRHYIYGFTAKPWEQRCVPADISDDYFQQWYITHNFLESAMAEQREWAILPMNPDHKSVYGMCGMLQACTTYNRDPELMKLDYTIVPKRKES